MNKVILMGRLTRDPDVRWTQGQDQQCVARFTLAVDRRGKREEGRTNADFISCVAFRGTAEWMEKWTHQGTKLTLSGRIQTGSYTNKDGQKVYTTDVVVEESEFAESKKSQEGGQQGNQSQGSYDADGFNDGFRITFVKRLRVRGSVLLEGDVVNQLVFSHQNRV